MIIDEKLNYFQKCSMYFTKINNEKTKAIYMLPFYNISHFSGKRQQMNENVEKFRCQNFYLLNYNIGVFYKTENPVFDIKSKQTFTKFIYKCWFPDIRRLF